MKENSLERRKQLSCYLLQELKKTCLALKELASDMGGSADEFLGKVFLESNEEIMSLVNEYNGNIHQVEEITQKMTARMNEWYIFAKDEKNLQKLFFPIRFHFEKNEVKKYLKQAREQISEKAIQNRFVKGKLDSMEEKLRCKAVLKIEMEDRYKSFSELMCLKKEITEHLSYLMPTIKDLCPVEYSIDDIDALLLKLSPV